LCLHVHIDYTSVTSHERLNATKAQAREIPLPRINTWKRANKHVELNWSTRQQRSLVEEDRGDGPPRSPQNSEEVELNWTVKSGK
jgi:hypothetical protein